MGAVRHLTPDTIATVFESDVLVPKEALAALGWTRVVATNQANSRDITTMMTELNEGNFSHTWRWFEPSSEGDQKEKLQLFENSRRPTRLFFYYGENLKGERFFIGGGAIAVRISHAFKVEGFPVVSRCYILSKYRGQRFYEPFLNHRILICQEALGAELKAIHLGTSNERVFAAMRKRFFESEFLYIGNENLEGKDNLVVKDFLLLSPRYKDAIQSALKTLPASIIGKKIKNQFKLFFENRSDECFYFHLVTLLNELGKHENWFVEDHPCLRELLEFFQAIPVKEIAVPAVVREVCPPLRPRARAS